MIRAMDCRYFRATPFHASMMTYYHMGPAEHILVKYEPKYNNYHLIKYVNFEISVCEMEVIMFSTGHEGML